MEDVIAVVALMVVWGAVGFGVFHATKGYKMEKENVFRFRGREYRYAELPGGHCYSTPLDWDAGGVSWQVEAKDKTKIPRPGGPVILYCVTEESGVLSSELIDRWEPQQLFEGLVN
jgi:hypothetical protein